MFLPREWCSKGKAQMRKSMGLGSTGQERWMFPISYQFCPKILKYMYVCLASLPLWLSLVMPGFECKLKGFPRWTICHSSKTSPSQQFTATLTEQMRWYPGEGNVHTTKQKNWWPTKNVHNVFPPQGWLSKSLWQVHVVRWLWVSLEPAKLWQRFHHTWKHQLVL